MFFRPGSEIISPEMPFGRIGVEICRDINYPEITRTQAYRGALLFICISGAPVTSVTDVPLHDRFRLLGRARAVENCAWYAYVNLAGRDEEGNVYAGGSFIANQSGDVVEGASAGANAHEEIIAHNIDMAELVRSRIIYPHLREARPDVLKHEIEAMRKI
jgi:predicted amidohydrolase